MEVGAVKQAFNNEVILLKKKLNQAKIQIIHKLTRKAKTMTEKKAPEKLKSKYNKKAESAVKEVLIIKKIKPRDIARFIVTHKGQLNEYLNRPTVDNDKACARLLLHKALQDKYKLIRERFSNIPIKDLLMSRQERRKLKKEEREKQKNKNKGKQQSVPVRTEGDWDVEDINMDASQVEEDEPNRDSESSNEEYDQDDDRSDVSTDGNEESDGGNEASDDESTDNVNLKADVKHLLNKHYEKAVDDSKESTESDYEVEPKDKFDDGGGGTFVKVTPSLSDANIMATKNNSKSKVTKINVGANNNKNVDKHKDSHKNKNLNHKILTKKFNKDVPEVTLQENKVVDPFFITATGENYLTLAEPRQPDEIKEVHRQGNRKYRRAVMFGHVPKAKIRRDDFRHENENKRFSKFDNNNGNENINTSFKSNGFERREPQQRHKLNDFGNRGKNTENRNEGKRNIEESKPEKLHPSWEAKKRQSGILPFQGKKIVFNEN